jgi:hypothetical protein
LAFNPSVHIIAFGRLRDSLADYCYKHREGTWQKVAIEIGFPWQEEEKMYWQLGKQETSPRLNASASEHTPAMQSTVLPTNRQQEPGPSPPPPAEGPSTITSTGSKRKSKSKWESEEHNRLMKYRDENKWEWKKISEKLGRTVPSCRGHYDYEKGSSLLNLS